MDESEDNMSAEDVRKMKNPLSVKKPKKRSLVERELETSLTARITSPVVISDGISTSRYGRARRLKSETEHSESRKVIMEPLKSPGTENTPLKVQSPVYRMHASNSPHKTETPKKALEAYLDNQIDNIYQENMSLSRFSEETRSPSPAKKYPKVYIRKDLIQNREEEETIILIKNLFSPAKSAMKSSSSHPFLDSSSEKKSLKQNGHVDNTSVVKTLDFDGKKKKENQTKMPEEECRRDLKVAVSKNELFEMEAKCPYQVGDLAWARMGTFPFWPCIITREPSSGMFVKKKLFGRVEHDIMHVTFFGDNGRRSWIVDNMLRNYLGLLEFEATREQFTPEDKKKDPRLYAAFFISEKKQALWNTSVEEAETLLREPKRLRIDIFNDMLLKFRASKKNQKGGKITRTDSDVSLSESLYDSLFSEDDVKIEDVERTRNRSRNKSFDVSEVVTACLDNMAAKTGITKIQRQSHMDRWLQKAKSKTPEKTQAKAQVVPQKVERKLSTKSKKKSSVVLSQRPYRLRRNNESQSKLSQSSHDESKIGMEGSMVDDSLNNPTGADSSNSVNNNLGVIAKVEPLADNTEESNRDTSVTISISIEISNPIIQPKKEPAEESSMNPNEAICETSHNIEGLIEDTSKINSVSGETSDALSQSKEIPLQCQDQDTSKVNLISGAKCGDLPQLKEVLQQENTNTSVQAIGRKPDLSEANQDSAMQLDEDPNAESAEKGEKTSSESKTVSNESMEDVKVQLTDENTIKIDTGLKDSRNDVTIESSVTETKNDDTIVCEAEEGQQGGYNKLKLNKTIETKVNDNNFLDKSNSQNADMAETRQVASSPKNTSTPEKSNKCKTEGNMESTSGNILNDKSDVNKVSNLKAAGNFRYSNEIVAINYRKVKKRDATSASKENNMSIDENINDGDQLNAVDNVLNESVNSESILQLEGDDIDNENCDTTESILNTLVNESNRSESVLDSYLTNANTDRADIVAVTNMAQSNCLNDVNILDSTLEEKDITSRDYVESPTFTQRESSPTKLNEITNLTQYDCLNDVNIQDSTLEENDINTRQYVESPTFTQKVSCPTRLDTNRPDSDLDPVINMSQSDSFRDVDKVDSTFGENYSSSRQYTESPTFTQLLESEEFFRDVNDTCDSKQNQTDMNNDRHVDEQDLNEQVQLKSNHNKQVNNIAVSNIESEVYEDEETSDDEPSPEYESLDEDIAEDFRKHMMSIENNVTDKKDEEQIVKICNEIAEKAKLSPIKYTIDAKCEMPKPNVKLDIGKEANSAALNTKSRKSEKQQITIDRQEGTEVDVKTPKVVEGNANHKKGSNENEFKTNDSTVKAITDKRIYKTRLSLNSVTKDRSSPGIKMESFERDKLKISDPRVVITSQDRNKADNLKIPRNKTKSLEDDKTKNRHSKSRLSLKRDSPKSKPIEKEIIDIVEPEIKVENTKHSDRKSEILKEEILSTSKVPTKINIENGAIETNIPEPVKMNGYHSNDRQCTDTPDLLDDTDFDIDAVSLNSEDSEVSLTNSIENVPRRNLRSRPERTLENALKNPEFLKYLELRQDYLMDDHPDLNEDEILTYVYKTWQYEEDLKCNVKKSDDAHHSSLVKGLKQETPSRKKSKKTEPKDSLQKYFHEKYEKCRKTFDFDSESGFVTSDSSETVLKQNSSSKSSIESGIESSKDIVEEVIVKRESISKSMDFKDVASENSSDVVLVKDKYKDLETVSVKSDDSVTPKKSLRSKASTPKTSDKQTSDGENNLIPVGKVKEEREFDTESIDSEDSEIPLRQLRSKVLKAKMIEHHGEGTSDKNAKELTSEIKSDETTVETKVEEAEESASVISDNEPLLKPKKKKMDKNAEKTLEDPEFIKYMELRQDALMDENPQLTQHEIVTYLFKTWLYEENSKSDLKKNDELEQASLVKGLNNNETAAPKKIRKKLKVEKQTEEEPLPRQKPRRRTVQPYYNEDYSDIEDEIEMFEIFKTKKHPITVVSTVETEKDKPKSPKALKSENEAEPPEESLKTETVGDVETIDTKEAINQETDEIEDEVEYVDEIELYFAELIKPKPNVFKGLLREKVCDLCDLPENLVKCKGCSGMFHVDCVKKETEVIELSLPSRGRKKKKKLGRKPKSLEDSESHSDEKSQDVSVDMSVEEILPPDITIDANTFEAQLAVKMKELLENAESNYESYSSDDGIDWKDTVAGKCEIVDVKLKRKSAPIDYSDFKCNNCQKYDTPVCFVCKSAVSKSDVKMRQKCHVAHCHKYYHLECLDHWPQTQFNSGEPSRSNKKINEFFEALTCPRHVCHTCVSDDPRGCKTRFSGDKLAKCVRCPATYHTFNKCLPAGTQILTASHILCPRHYDHRPGKVPCHVNTGWCFICAQGGSLICCEYCPTSFHAECLNIKPPEGNYMCEDCETGRLPLYGEMVWVKLGHYRWWPGIILHPSEIPENIMAVKHGLGEFVVRFFGQYDHYWVNRGRVFPYQEGDSGRISSQKSKIDAAFTTAIEHAQRAYEILKHAESNDEESIDIASSLLPPHYVKLKCNKPCGSLCGRKVEDPSLSLTQCECNPDEPDPCGIYSQCLNRMLLTECGPTCRAGDRCNNRAFEKRLYPKLVPYRTPHRGWGLKTLEDIKTGQFVIEYVGELIDEEEFKRRMRRKHEIRDENFYFLTLDKERMIDAGPKGNLARFMNHCCEPNCETQKWTVLGDIRVGLFAIDDIPANSEVTFNYNLECAGIDKKRCMCGAKRCSGYIGAKPKQEETQSKKTKDGKLPAKRTYKKKKLEDSPSTSKNKQKKPVGRPPKPKELTEIEKDLLIIKSATNSMSSDESSRSQSLEDKNPKTLKRKRVSMSTEEVSLSNVQEPSEKKQKCEEKSSEVGD